jgi:hypothetical protein
VSFLGSLKEQETMKKTIKAIIVLFSIITGGIGHADPLGTGCQTIFDFNTGKYTKICCNNVGKCTIYTF